MLLEVVVPAAGLRTVLFCKLGTGFVQCHDLLTHVARHERDGVALSGRAHCTCSFQLGVLVPLVCAAVT